MKKVELEVAMLRSGIRIQELSEKICMNRTTFYRKVATGKFERSEIMRIRDVLNLSDEDMLRIFFDSDGFGNATGEEENEPATETEKEV